MKSILTIATCVFTLCGCTKTATGSMTPIQAVGCDIQTLVTSGLAASVATALSCTNQTQIQTDLQSAFGNANLCAAQAVSTANAAQVKAAKAAAKPMGIVGNIACPIAINTVIGFLSNSVPTTWGCSASATAAALSSALTAACETAIPI